MKGYDLMNKPRAKYAKVIAGKEVSNYNGFPLSVPLKTAAFGRKRHQSHSTLTRKPL